MQSLKVSPLGTSWLQKSKCVSALLGIVISSLCGCVRPSGGDKASSNVIGAPTVQQVLKRVGENYARIHDLTCHATNTVVRSDGSMQFAVQRISQKGGYRSRTENAGDGTVEIVNHNIQVLLDNKGSLLEYHDARDWADSAEEHSSEERIRQLEDFWWDMAAFRAAYKVEFDPEGRQGIDAQYQLIATRTDGTETNKLTIDYLHGIPVAITEQSPAGGPLYTEFLQPVEVAPRAWLPTQTVTKMPLLSGSELGWRTALFNIRCNIGLSDRLFDVPPSPEGYGR